MTYLCQLEVKGKVKRKIYKYLTLCEHKKILFQNVLYATLVVPGRVWIRGNVHGRKAVSFVFHTFHLEETDKKEQIRLKQRE